MRRHADSNRNVVFAVVSEIQRLVALMVVNDKQSVAANPPSFLYAHQSVSTTADQGH